MPRVKKSAKKIVKKAPAKRKPVRRPKKAVPPTAEGVFGLVYSKPGFLQSLLTDMDAALLAAHLDLPATEKERVKNTLAHTYSFTGAEALSILVDMMTKRVPPLQPEWAIMKTVIVEPPSV